MRVSVGIKLGGLLVVVLGITAGAVLYTIDRGELRNLNTLMYKQAHQLFRQIVITREWNEGYGGVYVKKRAGDEGNRFLSHVTPGEMARDTYSYKPPAVMAKELSMLSGRAGLVRFRLVSLKPVNPENAADPFDRRWLTAFDAGTATEGGEIVEQGGHTVYRYVAPLMVTEACLPCHGHQGYKVGDVRGGISLFLPMDTEQAMMAENRASLYRAGGLLALLLTATLVAAAHAVVTRPVAALGVFAVGGMGRGGGLAAGLLTRRDEVGDLARTMDAASAELHQYHTGLEALVAARTAELEAATRQLDTLSRTDPLTGLNNRRHMELETPKLIALSNRAGKSTAFIMADIDHFKRFNDEHGHEVGDLTLAHVAALYRANARPYDLLVRWGGEEFLVVLPSCDAAGATAVAERIRQAIQANPVQTADGEIGVTSSFGVYAEAGMPAGAAAILEAVRRADQAMYRSKEQGRNRVTPWTEDAPDGASA
ncbi:MAG: diguanylate cyclase [Nitrospirae bacterium]|nr:diguanylate cyclase [Nitrospirota bacterium]